MIVIILELFSLAVAYVIFTSGKVPQNRERMYDNIMCNVYSLSVVFVLDVYLMVKRCIAIFSSPGVCFNMFVISFVNLQNILTFHNVYNQSHLFFPPRLYFSH